MINVKNGCLSLLVGKKKLEFTLSKVTASPTLKDSCYQVNVIDKVVFEEMGPFNSPSDLLEASLLGTLDNRLEEQYMPIYLIWLHFFFLNTIQERFLLWS